MNNELFADDSPMVEGSVEPNHSSNDVLFGDSVPASQPNIGNGFGGNDGFGGNNAGFGDFILQSAAPVAVASPPIHQDANLDDFAPIPVSNPAVTAIPQTAAADDGFFSAPAAPSPAPTASVSPAAPILSPGSQQSLNASSPGSNTSTTNAPPAAAVPLAFTDRGKAALEAQRRAIQERTIALDAATKKKEQDIQKKASDYLAEVSKKRDIAIATAKADHLKEQQQYEAKMSQFKKSGAVWNSVNLLVDTKKPNAYSKNTEYMRKLIGELRQE